MADEIPKEGFPIDQRRAMRLERIFLPSAAERRAAFYNGPPEGQNPSATFVHYTSAKSALSIIDNKCIWMRSTTCMSDFREVHHGFTNLQKMFDEAKMEDALEAALKPIYQGTVADALNQFRQWWGHIPVDTFITSVSEHVPSEDNHGRLSMWRAMRSGGPRVAIVIRVPWRMDVNQALGVVFAPVSYASVDQIHAEFKTVLARIAEESEFLRSQDRAIVVATLFNMLRAHVVAAKHEGFHEEREWRVIYSPKMQLSPPPLMKSSIEVLDDLPQTIHKIPLDGQGSDLLTGFDIASLFDRLIIGPTQYPWVMHEAFTGALKRAGVAEPKISLSLIPIRT